MIPKGYQAPPQSKGYKMPGYGDYEFNNPYGNPNGNPKDYYNQGDVGGIIGLQYDSSQQAKAQQQGNMNQALQTLQGGGFNMPIEQAQGLIQQQLQQLMNPTGFKGQLQGSIQSVLDNPDVLSQQQMDQFKQNAKQQAGIDLYQQQQNAASQSAGSGLGLGGMTQQQLAKLGVQSNLGLNQQFNDLEMAAAQAKANNLAGAQGLGNQLAGIDAQTLQSLLGYNTQLAGQASGQNQQNALAQAEILANAQINPNDYSGILDLMLAQQQGNQQQDFQQKEFDLLSQQIQGNQGLQAAYLQSLFPQTQLVPNPGYGYGIGNQPKYFQQNTPIFDYLQKYF